MRKERSKSIDKFLLVSNQPLFESLSNKEKAFIANRAQVVEYNKDDLICSEGQKKDYLYLIISGRVCLFHPSSKTPWKKAAPIEILRKTDYFGIISLLTGRTHSLSATAINNARILRIDQKSFREIIREIPSLGIHFSRELSKRLKRKYGGVKEVFKSTVLALYSATSERYFYDYAASLIKSIRQESGKKCALLYINSHLPKSIAVKDRDVKNIFTDNPKDISPILDEYTGSYHFVIAVLPPAEDSIAYSFLEQSDSRHLLCDYSESGARNMKGLIAKLKLDGESTKIILREGEKGPNSEIRAGAQKILPFPVYATLPFSKEEFQKAVRRISREITGARVGLALGSGGALGLAQIGVLEVIEKEKIPIDILAGTSMGALVGALWAAGYDSAAIKKICRTINTRLKIFTLIDLTFPRRGLLAGRKIRALLTKHLGNKTFQDIKLPFKAVACDIKTREEVVIKEGSLVDAVMASIAIPGVINPFITKDGRMLVDGGIVTPLPINILSRDGVKKIVAVNSIPSPEDESAVSRKRHTIIDIMVNSMYAMEYRIAKYASQEADVYIHPILKNAAWYEFYKTDDFVRVGKKGARGALADIRALVKRS